jgi:hypothetical protein
MLLAFLYHPHLHEPPTVGMSELPEKKRRLYDFFHNTTPSSLL